MGTADLDPQNIQVRLGWQFLFHDYKGEEEEEEPEAPCAGMLLHSSWVASGRWMCL